MRRQSSWILLACAALGGCVGWREPTVPMPVLRYPAPRAPATGLVALLPGLGDAPERFAAEGIVAALQSRDPHLEVVACDAHAGYYRGPTVVERLHDDVLGPTAARYARHWLVGVSLGGIGALSYAREHPGQLDGLILLAPFLGPDELLADIHAAGGLAQWTPPPAESLAPGRRRYVELWTWLQRFATEPMRMPQLFVGCGDEDRMAPGIALLAAVLPADHLVTRPGGHAWTTWAPLFAELVLRALPPATP